MSEWIRVRDKETGHHVSIQRSRYAVDPDLWDVLKQSATHIDGTPLPPKFSTSVSKEAAKKTHPRGQTADTEKE